MTTMIGNKYPDEYIEKWAEVYLANPGLRQRGVLFVTFLALPEEILAAHMDRPQLVGLDFLPLLAKQKAASDRIFMATKRYGQTRVLEAH